jgi:hypothetical protein
MTPDEIAAALAAAGPQAARLWMMRMGEPFAQLPENPTDLDILGVAVNAAHEGRSEQATFNVREIETLLALFN